MILSLASRYQKHIALFLLSISFVQITIAERVGRRYVPYNWGNLSRYNSGIVSGNARTPIKQPAGNNKINQPVITSGGKTVNRPFVGGPTQPESQSFSSVNSNNMVDLFSGDFSYNIPLLDVGGYPVNIAYHSGITMDEEASWVGLGWNINPGSITRNMRGVPDDFNGGTDTIKKVSSIKPNVSWGVTVGANLEVIGLPTAKNDFKGDTGSNIGVSVGASFGIFHNTYKGWGIERSINASISAGAKSHGGLSAGLSLTNSSQEGISINPSLGYKYKATDAQDNFGGGFQISSPYNSRTGLKAIQLGLNANARNKSNQFLDGGGVTAMSFSWPAAMPYMTMPMTNYNVSVTLKLGSEFTGLAPNLYVSGYYGQESIRSADKELSLPVFGYLNYQNMNGNWTSLTDFNREKELAYREKPAVPHVAVPSYTYDVFSISGEGTGGSFRPYRGDIGFIADHRSQSKTLSGGVSIDIGGGNLVHGGVDLNANYSNTKTGPWESENAIGTTIGFRKNKGLYEGVYFRNPAEKAINTTAYYDAIGGDDVVAPALSQDSKSSPTIIATNTLNRYKGKTKVGSIDLNKASAVHNTRDKRSQVISYLTAAEAAVVGLDKHIDHYAINNFERANCDTKAENENDVSGSGLFGYYFNGTSHRGNYVQRNDTTVYFNWEKGKPVNGVSDNYFSVRWLGRVKAPETGTYTFAMKCDDGFRLWINDTILIDKWKKPVGWDSCKVNLVKDKFYNVKIEYYENAGYAHVEFLWKKPSDPTDRIGDNNKKRVPKQYLYPPLFRDTFDLEPAMVRENRVNNYRKSSHISEVDVLNADGRKYVYGIPVYNILQKEVSFSIEARGDRETGLTDYTSRENSTDNESGKDGYYSRQEMPAYAHSYLLSGILSPDYVDVTGDGISDDDQGDAVKFNYSKAAGIAKPYEWRAPYSNKANYNEGLKSYNRDDKAHYIYGKKEVWYLHTIESKTMIATFTLEGREDLLEITEGGTKMNNNKAFRLKQIDLYSKADFLTPGRTPTPIKTVHFEYSYELCPGVNQPYNNNGKLTLKRIWFTYNGNEKGKLNPYVFNYHNNNPAYRTNASDKWGTYKHPSQNPDGPSNADYPYALQDSTLAAYNAGAWMLDSIQLPSGGRIKVKYESDDYAYVQNKRAAQMMEIAGFGQGSSGSISENLYDRSGFSTSDNLFIYVKIPKPVGSKKELYARYLEGMSKLYFRLLVQMPSNDGWGTGSDYVSCYAEPDVAAGNWYGTTSNPNVIWIKIAGINKKADGGGSESPLVQAAINFLRLNIPSKAYPGSEVKDNIDFRDGVKILLSQLGNIVFMLNGFANTARQYNWGRKTMLARSYVRLNAPTLKKYGGGLRVKSILIYDHWNAMTKKKESVYGQTYDYTKIQTVNGDSVRISSGVAAWEPMIGGEENPFHLPIEYQDRVSALAPTSLQYSEEPLGESFYPGASVGYSKVRVRSIRTAKTRSANGYAESTFYTAYDFPTTWDWSMLDNDTKKRYKPLLKNFLRINAKSYLSISQGFKIELNDMNGKLRSAATYSETDAVHPVSYTENFYRVDNQSVEFKHLNNVVTVIKPDGSIDTAATIGKDVELMADMREQTSTSIGGNVNVNVDLFAAGVWPVALPSLLNLYQKETNQFRSAAMTKVIYRYGIIDSVVHIEKGSKISTKNILYDAETGDPLLTRTQNEFNDPIYQFTYPAHWVYKGVAPAYQNIGVILEHLKKVVKGKIDEDGLEQPISTYLTAGDELLVYSKETTSATACNNKYATFPDAFKLWVIDSNAISGGTPQLFLVDANGVPFSGNDVTLKVIRSGHRNINATVGSVTSLINPLKKDGAGNYQLVINNATGVVNAQANEMAQYWKVADKKRSDKEEACVPTFEDSARFAAEACSCLQPFFNYLIANNRLFIPRRGFLSKTVGQLVSAAGINVSGCPILQDNLNEKFYSISAGPNEPIYRAMIGKISVTLERRSESNSSFYNYTTSICTPEGVIFKDPAPVIPQPDTVTVRIAPDYSANLLSTETCPTFNDSLTQRDAASDRLLVENGLNMGGYERNAIAVMNFNRLDDIPGNATVLSANMILTADQRGHQPAPWTNANSVHPVDSLSVSLATPGYFPGTSLETIHNQILSSAWHREVKRIVPFQNDTIDVLDYVNGYRSNAYTSNSFMLSQGSRDLHTNYSGYGESYESPAYLQSGYGNYYSTYYNQRYADPAKWPVIEVTYVIPAPFADTAGARLVYNSTVGCTDDISRFCYSAVTDTVVNPYQYGILGNFHPLRSYVYYGRRNESDPLQGVNTRTNGTIKDFAPFWIYQNNKWAPSYDTTRWVWNSQATLFNRKGFELENKDPLGRYNSGLFGYNLTMPTAVIQNAHYQEGAYEGFEDYDFRASTCDVLCPEARHFDFSGYQSAFTTTQAHTGLYSLQVPVDSMMSITAGIKPATDAETAQLTSVTVSDACTSTALKGLMASKNTIIPGFAPLAGKQIIVGGWVKEDNSCLCKGYTRNHILISFLAGGNVSTIQLSPSGNLVEGWQRYESVVAIPANATQMTITLQASDSATTWFDDIRIHPYNAHMKSYVYNPVNLRMMAELDENNYATFYEYDDDGTMVRLKKETERGVQTIKETRSGLFKE